MTATAIDGGCTFDLGDLGTYEVKIVDDAGTERIQHRINGFRVWSLTPAGGHLEPVKHGSLPEAQVHMALDGDGAPEIPLG